jgi:hypothetical protein
MAPPSQDPSKKQWIYNPNRIYMQASEFFACHTISCVVTSCLRSQMSHKARGAPVCFRSWVLTDSTFFQYGAKRNTLKAKHTCYPTGPAPCPQSTSACMQSSSLLHMSCNCLHYMRTLYMAFCDMAGMRPNTIFADRQLSNAVVVMQKNPGCILCSELIQRSASCGVLP